MKKYCQKEQAVVAALRSGTLFGELLVHVSSCPFCSEVVLVMESLREDAAFVPDVGHTPDPSRIWQLAQDLVREKAVEKSSLPIRIAWAFAFVTAILAMPWLLLILVKLPWVNPDLVLSHLPLLDRSWSPALTNITLFSVAVTLICTGFSSWYILEQ